MKSEFGLVWIFLTLTITLHVGGVTGGDSHHKNGHAPKTGSKQKGTRDKFILTSTSIDEIWEPVPFRVERNCIRIDLYVPGSRVPLPLCLRRKSPKGKMPGFHKEFKLRIARPNGEKPEVEPSTRIFHGNQLRTLLIRHFFLRK